jgi:xanthine dehydrogenase FAD-binding subunit
MKTVHTPYSLEELLSLRRIYPAARLMAGGTDLLVHLRNSIPFDHQPLILLRGIKELQNISMVDGLLSIGAGITFSRLAACDIVRRNAPVLVKAALKVGGPAIRNMATLGGNICTASPAGDSIPPLFVYDAELEILSPFGTRRVSILNFFNGPGKTILAPYEILLRIILPCSEQFPFHTFLKAGNRRAMSIAVASFAALARTAPDGTIREARFAWGSVAPTVIRFPQLELELQGKKPDRETIRHAAATVSNNVSPIDDIRGSVKHRRNLAGNMLSVFLEHLNG